MLVYFKNRHQIKTFVYVSPRSPLFIADHISGKKVSLIIFKQKFYPKILPVALIFSLTIMNNLKKFIGIKSLNTKQCAARLSPPPVKLSGFD